MAKIVGEPAPRRVKDTTDASEFRIRRQLSEQRRLTSATDTTISETDVNFDVTWTGDSPASSLILDVENRNVGTLYQVARLSSLDQTYVMDAGQTQVIKVRGSNLNAENDRIMLIANDGICGESPSVLKSTCSGVDSVGALPVASPEAEAMLKKN